MSARGQSENSDRIDWNIYEACPGCGAREGAKCFSSNGSRKRFPCASRPFTPDAIAEKFLDYERALEALSSRISELAGKFLKQQKQIDLLLGEVEQ